MLTERFFFCWASGKAVAVGKRATTQRTVEAAREGHWGMEARWSRWSESQQY